ncbi:hypothetical protein L6164_037649 [Bauhinia variegata]|uniref:Uncharacterized protein n=1 Tax=Bauhinia variegata TaxID=167791 RepID=A0ACB9KKW2_BAUVA|nr:hypothetical protein L6164_037649 [Bauhinia variegata]
MNATKSIQRYSFLAILVLLCSLRLNSVIANEYIVGDEELWSSQSNYAIWADKYNFSMGDVLVFKYLKGEHNVYQVSEDTYRSCDTSSGVLAKYDSGEDQVELSEAKRYWFICNIPGHCLGGMRFGIQVRAANSTQPPIEPTPSDNSSTSFFHESRTIIRHIIPFWIIVQLVLFM